MSEHDRNVHLTRYRLENVIHQFMDFRGRTPLKLGMEWGGGDIRALSANNVQMGRIDFSKEAYFGSETLYKEWMTKGDCEKGDVILTTEAPLGNVAQIPDNKKYILSQRTILLKAEKSKADSDYLLHLFQSEPFQESLVRNSTGTTVVGIQQAKLAKIEIELPPLPEQRKIAKILTTVDNLIEKTEALIAKYQAIKQGMMHDLFTRGVDEHGQLRPPYEEAPELYKESELGWIPREWEAKKLGDVLREISGFLQTGPFGSQLHAYEYVNEGVPVIMPQDINEGQILIDEIAKVSEAKAQSMIRHRVQSNDIVFSRRGDLSRAVAISEKETGWLCGTGCFLMRAPLGNLEASWLAYSYRYDFVQRQVEANAVGSTMPSLNNAVMARLLIAFPQYDEQVEIGRRLKALDARLQSEFAHRYKLTVLKTCLMQDLLTGKVRVNVDKAEEASS